MVIIKMVTFVDNALHCSITDSDRKLQRLVRSLACDCLESQQLNRQRAFMTKPRFFALSSLCILLPH